MIFLFTDFGHDGPYLGQVAAVLARSAPSVPAVPLFNDVPPFDARGAAYLLSAYTSGATAGDVVLAVVDPGVGTVRRPLALCADGVWYVGPDNGLLAIVAQRARAAGIWKVRWRPEKLSKSFHGRDLFAPAAAALALRGQAADAALDLSPIIDSIEGQDWPPEHSAVVYCDRYGNAVTGRRAESVARTTLFEAGGRTIGYAATFGEVPTGEAFWYENANGLVELAVNQGSARKVLGLEVGSPISPAKSA